MALHHKWGVKNGFVYVLQFFALISDGLGCVSFGALSKDQILWEGHNILKKSPNLYNFCGLLRISELLIILKTLAVVAFRLPRIRPRKWFALRQDFFNERGTQREFLKITSKALILSKRLGNYGINRVKFVSLAN